jgi:hypothetical protein
MSALFINKYWIWGKKVKVIKFKIVDKNWAWTYNDNYLSHEKE